MRLGVEEKMSYVYSIENLAALKLFHDAGVDVSSFPDYMIDINYNSDSTEIIQAGCEALFGEFALLNTYDEKDEENEELYQIFDRLGISLDSEYYYICSCSQMRALCKNPIYQQKFEDLFKDDEGKTKVVSQVLDGIDHVDSEEGHIIIGFEYVGELHETAKAIVHAYNEINRLYYEMIESENNEVSN